ncbi:MAG: asparaginase [Alphaproteobacteria bacterium]|nr:asparaginase [Alphaproteobacteria bacterium]MEC8726435.1 asparaginase domain-containing protein [Pseudomonadota bacterium]MEC9153463.1 asparaginase domain-containing protein [Pseudomonadota bacterium]
MTSKPRIAYLSGSNATISNSPPLVTSNKARAARGLSVKTNPDGSKPRYDVLRPQRLAAPVTVYVEQFSAHPLESDAADLYGPPDGYVDTSGTFRTERQSDDDIPAYRIELSPDDGLYPMPYMAFQADGSAWEDDCAFPGAPANKSRQAYYPDGSRIFEEIDRFGIAEDGTGNLASRRADVDFFRIMPSGGYTKGQSAHARTDVGDGDIEPEMMGRDFFAYRPVHLASSPSRDWMARMVNNIQDILDSGDYLGAIWTQGSPRIEETLYWLNLILDTTLPVCGNAAQRTHGEISNDGPKNLVDSIDYITSRVWEGGDGRNRAGTVVIQEQQIFASREVQKGEARPGGYVATGGHGGLLGAVRHGMPPILTYLPGAKHTYQSDVNRTRLPLSVIGYTKSGSGMKAVDVAVKDRDGKLLGSAIPKVTITKEGNYSQEAAESGPEREVDLIAQIEDNLANAPLAGFVVEGQSPYGSMTNAQRNALMTKAVYSGMPVVRVGRGNNEGFSARAGVFLGGSNLTSTKARLTLIACLLKFGALPPAVDPLAPTEAETGAIQERLDLYQTVFDTH